MTRKDPPPAPLEPAVAKKLLDLLSTDNDFRRLFRKDAHAALVKAGYQAPPGTDPSRAPRVSGGHCLQLKPGERLAPKAKIVRDRAKLESMTTRVMQFIGARSFKAD
jgi:putative modified peptide